MSFGGGPGAAAPRFGRVITAMATPFDEAGRLDLDGAVVLARHLLAHGSDALVLSGTTGEVSTLDDGERLSLWQAVSAAVPAPVIVGATSNDTRHSLELTAAAAGCGAAGVLAVTPYYSRPSQAGIEAHFRAVAASTDLPVILYDIPVRTGRRLARDTVLSLARQVGNVVALKDAAGDLAGTAQLIAAAPPGFEVYSGEDALTLPLLSVGAVGVISVASHWCGEEFSELIAAFVAGEVARARQLNAALIPSFGFETGDEAPNPIPTKAMLRVLGLPAGECRLPLGIAPPGLEERARAVLAELAARRARRGGAVPAGHAVVRG